MAVSRLLKSCAIAAGQHAQALDPAGLLEFFRGAVTVGDVVENEHRAGHLPVRAGDGRGVCLQ